jgi:hypothetical protein
MHLATGGYLQAPGRPPRYIPGLETLASDTLRAGVQVQWGMPEIGTFGCSYLWSRVIVLAPWIYECENWLVRWAWSHELAHCVSGRQSERQAHVWQWKHYGEILLPAWVG